LLPIRSQALPRARLVPTITTSARLVSGVGAGAAARARAALVALAWDGRKRAMAYGPIPCYLLFGILAALALYPRMDHLRRKAPVPIGWLRYTTPSRLQPLARAQ